MADSKATVYCTVPLIFGGSNHGSLLFGAMLLAPRVKVTNIFNAVGLPILGNYYPVTL